MTDLESYTPEVFKERYQIDYTQFLDLKAMMGDKSDNLPGIPGIGEKKAVKYLQLYGSLDNIIAHKEEIKGADGIKIKDNVESALLCRKMATILTDFDLKVGLEETYKKEMDRDKLISFYQELEFKSLLKELMPPVKSIVKTNIEVVDDLLRLKEILLPYSALVFETFDENYHRSPLLYVGLKNRLGTFIIRPEWIGQSIDLQLFLSDSQNHKSIYDYKKHMSC